MELLVILSTPIETRECNFKFLLSRSGQRTRLARAVRHHSLCVAFIIFTDWSPSLPGMYYTILVNGLSRQL